MTTRVTIKNESESNGDLFLKGFNTCEGKFDVSLLPGEEKSVWVTDHSVILVTETWPTNKVKAEELSVYVTDNPTYKAEE